MTIVVPDPGEGISIDQQAAQGFLTLPWLSQPVTITTGFSTSLAKNLTQNPFVFQETPFETTALEQQRFIYHRHNNCRGNFISTTTTNASRANEHMSIDLGVTIGNEYLNAGVSGSYDKSVVDNRATSKSSLKCTFNCGSLRPYYPLKLSTTALTLLRTSGLDAFKQRYGDYYINSLNLGGDSAVLVYTSSLDTSNVEKAKITAEATFLCWSTETTLLEEEFAESHSEVKFGITAFDTLSGAFVDVGPDKEDAKVSLQAKGQGSPTQAIIQAFFNTQTYSLGLEKTRQLASKFGILTADLPDRVATLLEGYKWLLNPHTGGASLGWEGLKAVVESGLVVQMTLLPFEKLREVQEVLRAAV